MNPARRAMAAKTVKDTKMKSSPSIRNWISLSKISLNRNPGKKAKKKIATLGFNTFMINPFLNRLNNPLVVCEVVLISIAGSLLYTMNAKYKRYPAPKSLMIKKMVGFSLIKTEKPKVNKAVCTKQPAINPATVANPCFLPLAKLKVRTKILSGPGAKAKSTVADANAMRVA